MKTQKLTCQILAAVLGVASSNMALAATQVNMNANKSQAGVRVTHSTPNMTVSGGVVTTTDGRQQQLNGSVTANTGNGSISGSASVNPQTHQWDASVTRNSPNTSVSGGIKTTPSGQKEITGSANVNLGNGSITGSGSVNPQTHEWNTDVKATLHFD